VAIGGMLALNEQRDIRETPGLSKIPLIGKYLFSRDANSLVRTNVIILVTPRIIRSGNSPVITAGCDEEHGLDLAEREGSTIIAGKNKKGYVRRANQVTDPSDPFQKECAEKNMPAGQGKTVIKRSGYSKD
jgi:Flp pilus assembly secretin CpaC